jgi:hypothetical protein
MGLPYFKYPNMDIFHFLLNVTKHDRHNLNRTICNHLVLGFEKLVLSQMINAIFAPYFLCDLWPWTGKRAGW